MNLWLEILRALLIFSAVTFLISGLDDVFVDFYYYIRRTYRRLFVEKKYPRLSEDDLRGKEECPVALVIPAWQEEAVIAKMLRNTLQWSDYGNYEIFVGTYPNDEATMRAVAEVQEGEPRVHRIVCPHDGPTNKADCLNWVVEGVRLHEKKVNKRFEIFVLHDSEDIVHPLSFKLFNYLMPRFDMVQLPVIPLEEKWWNFTAGTYLDEFAEFHTKDLLVRERVSRMVPSAGVGTGFSRDALDELGLKTRNQLFNVETLTEDYDIGFRLNDLRKRSILVQFALERTKVVQKGWLRKRETLKRVPEWVATREYFPTRLRDAVRQKSRWIVGIVFHGWSQLGWKSGKGVRYMLWRDRKALLANFFNIVGYVLFFGLAGTWLYVRTPGRASEMPVLVRERWLWYLLLIDTALMIHRILQRAFAVRRVADWKQSLLSVPRLFWGNVINFFAVCKASKDYVVSLVTGSKVVWTKTAHAFPDEKQLLEFKRKLGDLLLENRLLSLHQLAHALEVQKKSGERLGDVLSRLGYVREEQLVPLLGSQMRLEARRIDPAQVVRDTPIPEDAAREYTMLAVGGEDGRLVIAAANPDDADMKNWLAGNLRQPYSIVLGGRANLREAIEKVYAPAKPRLMLGELLVRAGIITAEQLATALEVQKASHKRIGEVLEELGYVSSKVIQEHITHQQQVRAVASSGSND